jgi:hypothetical protein
MPGVDAGSNLCDEHALLFFFYKKMPGVDTGSRSHVCDDGALERLRVTY